MIWYTSRNGCGGGGCLSAIAISIILSILLTVLLNLMLGLAFG